MGKQVQAEQYEITEDMLPFWKHTKNGK
jgi:hypothetical protein